MLLFSAPTQPPMNLAGHFVNHTAIEMNWTRVPEESRHGIISGYVLHFRDETISTATWHNITVPNRQNGSDYFSKIVNELKIYTPYSFKIQAFTFRGFGVISDAVTIWTDEHGKIFYKKKLFYYPTINTALTSISMNSMLSRLREFDCFHEL